MEWFWLVACHEHPLEPTPDAQSPAPNKILWAWSAAQDLHGLPEGVGVAFLDRTILGESGRVRVLPRGQPLDVESYTPLTAVVRLELVGTPDLAEVVPLVLAAAAHGSRLQLDFDATVSQRDWYRVLIGRVVAESPVPVSMTALVSWCMGDFWMQDFPAIEIVPMFFDMGVDDANIRTRLRAGEDVVGPCRGAWGRKDTDPLLPPGPRKEYIFHVGSWDSESVARALSLPSAQK